MKERDIGNDPKAARAKWEPGVKAATHIVLANLIRESCAFYYAATSIDSDTPALFNFLKEQGYQIRLIHATTPSASIKGKNLLTQRINDTYLAYADTIQFYYRNQIRLVMIVLPRFIMIQ